MTRQTMARRTTTAAVAKKAAEGMPAFAYAPGGGCWLVVHELHDSSAQWLAGALAALAGLQGPAVRAVPVSALMSWVRWQVRVERHGSACALDAPGLALQAGCLKPQDGAARPPDPRRARLAGVINRCGLVALPTDVPDADYKSAEWNALLMAWLHGLPVPVLNRPRCDNVLGTMASAAVWRQRAASSGLAVWPLAVQASTAQRPDAADPVGWPGLLVVGDTCLEPAALSDYRAGNGAANGATTRAASWAAPGWSATARRAAARAAATCGCDLLAWTGSHDAQGYWRVAAATAWPDLRPFGAPALQALARLMGLTRLTRPDGTIAQPTPAVVA